MSAVDLLRMMQGGTDGVLGTNPLERGIGAVPPLDRSATPDQGRAGKTGEEALGEQLRPQPVMPIELDYSLRANEPLRQFGYDAFRTGGKEKMPPTGAIQDSYQLGVGDELQITLHGQLWQSFRTRIDSSGRVIVANLPPVPAAGRSLGEFRAALRGDVSRSMLGTEVYVAVGNLRTVEVAVLGEVDQPGVYHLTALSSIVDALVRAGGPKKTGTLRNLLLSRGAAISRVDLYDLLIGGGLRQDLTLREGDRIVVPPIGPTVAIAGQVKRPGIYEIGRDGVSPLDRALGYAGGPIRPRGNRYIQITIGNDGRERIEEMRDIARRRASDGDVVIVQPGANVQLGGVWLEGAVRVPGRRSFAQARSVRQLIVDVKALAEDAYLPLAVIRRIDERSQTPLYLPVNLLAVLLGRADVALHDADRLIVLGRTDVEFLRTADVQAVLQQGVPPSLVLAGDQPAESRTESSPGPQDKSEDASSGKADSNTGTSSVLEMAGVDRAQLRDFRSALGVAQGEAAPAKESRPAEESGKAGMQPTTKQGLVRATADDRLIRTSYACSGLRTLSTIMQEGGADRFANARRVLLSRRSSEIVNIVSCPPLFDRYPDLIAYVLEYAVAVNGEVQLPGIYPLASTTSLDILTRIAGGLTREADLTSVEISRVPVSPQTGSSRFTREMVNLAGPGRTTALATQTVEPGDAVRFNRIFTQREKGPVLLSGEFRRPGVYNIRRGERLSQVIERAGGLTQQAYPFGAVFLRETARQAQKTAFDRAAEELEIALAAQAGTGRVNPAIVTAGDALVKRLRSVKPLGRVVIEAEPTVLDVHPEQDIILEPGDQLFMPKRAAAIHVSGAVLSPGTMQFASGKRAEDYIELAGGFAQGADDDRVFVVMPNGEAKRLQMSYWNYQTVNIPPGSTIVVPRNPAPFDLAAFLQNATDIVSKVAVTAASLVVIGR